jgi:hypothetical protein
MTEETFDKVNFQGLVAGIATSAVAVLGQVELLLETGTEGAVHDSAEEKAEPLTPEEITKRVGDGLTGARQLIDTLAVLEEKTAGNLSGEESELLQGALSELRIRYVSLANRPIKEGPAEGNDV